MRKLKVGDRVKITKEGWYNGCYDVGDTVYVVEVRDPEDSCPYYLSKLKVMKMGQYFGPYREAYEHVVTKNKIGGEIL